MVLDGIAGRYLGELRPFLAGETVGKFKELFTATRGSSDGGHLAPAVVTLGRAKGGQLFFSLPKRILSSNSKGPLGKLRDAAFGLMSGFLLGPAKQLAEKVKEFVRPNWGCPIWS